MMELDYIDIIDTCSKHQIDEKNNANVTAELETKTIPFIKYMEDWNSNFGRTDSQAIGSLSNNTESIASGIQESQCSTEKHEKHALEQKDALMEEKSFAMRLTKLSVQEILQKSAESHDVLRAYEKTGTLSEDQQPIIIDTIVFFILTKTDCLLAADCKDLASEIVKLFPTEETSFYFRPPIKAADSPTGKRQKEGGKLIEKYRYIREKKKRKTRGTRVPK